MIAGVLDKAVPFTVYLNPTEDSYKRLGQMKAPGYVSWSSENRSQLVRIPAASDEYRRAELRSPDPGANPYIAFALIIWAALDGINKKLPMPEPLNVNLYKADEKKLSALSKLPADLTEAKEKAISDDLIKAHIPEKIRSIYCD